MTTTSTGHYKPYMCALITYRDMYTDMYTHTKTHTDTHTHIHTQTYTHTDTYTQKLAYITFIDHVFVIVMMTIMQSSLDSRYNIHAGTRTNYSL